MKSKPWSKLQKQIYNLISSEINFQLHCSAYPMHSMWHGSTDLPRYWITLEKEILWDYPKDFMVQGGSTVQNEGYPYFNCASEISELLREYIDTPKNELFSKTYSNDKWGLVDILRAADRRIGKNQLMEMQKEIKNQAALTIISARLSK